MLLATLALAGAGMTGATFDATDLTPEYQTGIQNVYAVADDGTELYIPVYSLPECVEEDGTGDPCVWNASVRGNGIGQSYVQLGTEDNRIFADVTVWAAEILVSDAPVQSVEIVAPVQAVEPVEVPVKAVEPVVPVEEPVKAIDPVIVEEWAGAECDAQCEADMAVDYDQTVQAGFVQCTHEDCSGEGITKGVFFSERNDHAIVQHLDANGNLIQPVEILSTDEGWTLLGY